MALPIDRLNERFEGEFEFKRKVFRVPYTLPGDLVQFQLRFKGPKHERFKVLHVEAAESYPPDIALSEPFCPYHGRCGGCRAQHLAYDFQLKTKCNPVREKMKALSGVEPELLPAPQMRGYRNRMDFVVNGADCGLRPVGDFANFVDIESCGIQRDGANAALAVCRRLLAASECAGAAYLREDHSGALKYITVRQGVASGAIVLTVHGPARNLPAYLAFRDALRGELEAARTDAASPLFEYSLVETATETVESEISNPPGGTVLLGRDGFRESLGGLEFDVPYDAFFQPNPPAFDRLLEATRPWIDEELGRPNDLQSLRAAGAAGTADQQDRQDGENALVDLYSGAGVLSAVVAGWFPGVFTRVRGYESVASAVERAPANFQSVGITDPIVDFQTVDLLAPPADFLNGAARLIVLDPPRAGLSPAVREALIQRRPAPAMLYISCNPYSQMRDLEELAPAYEIKRAVLADCFPHTPHLEQAVWLTRRADFGPGEGETAETAAAV
jgi:tRNA (uracil-5-)-methyltransferase